MIGQQELLLLLKDQSFDCCAIADIDFKSSSFTQIEVNPWGQKLFYDLASLTKPLCLAALFAKYPQWFTYDMLLLLNHRAGMISGGRLSKHNWQQQILDYSLKESSVCYSDFGALRLQLEIEQQQNCSLQELSSFFWDQELVHWKELGPRPCPITGERRGRSIQGQVHDDNAYVLDCFTAHAGLFASIEGLAQSLINLNNEVDLLNKMNQQLAKARYRFVAGWDRVENPDKTLAGNLASKFTFGHLGFTGTSIWIDCIRKQGIILLTNATKKFWYSREGLNQLRRKVNNQLWN